MKNVRLSSPTMLKSSKEKNHVVVIIILVSAIVTSIGAESLLQKSFSVKGKKEFLPAIDAIVDIGVSHHQVLGLACPMSTMHVLRR